MKHSFITSTALALVLGASTIVSAADVMTPAGKVAMVGIDANKLLGRSVTTAANETVGTIDSVLTDKDGMVRYVLVGTGSFLGQGDRTVALNWDTLSFTQGSGKIVVNSTKAQLATLPAHRFADASLKGRVYLIDDDLRTNPYLAEAGRVPAAIAPIAPTQLAQIPNAVDTQKLVGRNIKNGNNDTIGDINGILVDRNGNAKFVVVGVGGFLGMGERQVALPWEALTIAQNGERVTAPFTTEQLKALPEYRFADLARRGTVYSYEDDLRTNAYLAEAMRAPAPAAQLAQAPNAVDTQKLIGRNIRNGSNETIGDINGVLIDRGGNAKFVVVGVGGFLGLGERQVALPWEALTITQNGERVMAPFTTEQLKALPEYRFANLAQRGTVYSYEDDLKTNAYLAEVRRMPTPAAQIAQVPAAAVDSQKIIGRNIRNGNNDTIGEINGVLIDRGGNAKFVVVGVGGFLGMGERQVALPWEALTITQNGERVMAPFTADQLKALPEYRFADLARRGTVYSYEDDLRTNAYLAEGARAPMPATATRPTIVTAAVDTQKLIGRNIKNSSNDTIGEIDAVLIEKDGSVKFVVVGVGGFLGIGEKQIALPWEMLTVTNNGETVMANFSKDELKALPDYKFATAARRRTVYSYEEDLKTNAYLANYNPAVGAPLAGANSFTEGQARARIEANGFTNVSALRKDEQSVWRGQAMKDGRPVAVAVDFKGNVVAQ